MNHWLIYETVNSKDIPENENANKIVNIVEKILDFNKQLKGKGLRQGLAWVAGAPRVAKVPDHKVFDCKRNKVLTPKTLLQRLSIALAQVKAGNTFENLLNEIRKIRYYLHQAKETTKKVYNNIINSINL